jgi:murein L,D-transpeptidase YcbB/YkuD
MYRLASIICLALVSLPLADEIRAEPVPKPMLGQSLRHAAKPSATRDMLAQNSEISIEPLDLTSLRQFYGNGDFRPVWTGGSDSSNAELAQSALEAAEREGLNPSEYHAKELHQLGRHSAWDATRYELLLTDGVLKYAHDVRLGRVPPNAVHNDVELPAQDFDSAAVLKTALANGTLSQFLADLAPPHMEYVQLRDALETYRKIAGKGGWLVLPVSAIADLEPSSPAFAALRARLAVEDSALDRPGQTGDDIAVLQALIHFQARHGLEPDGKLGPRTLEALNVPVATRITQISANMERWRWLPRSFEPNFITVNVPDATLIAVRDSKVILVSRVVVGKPGGPTPILRATATAVTVNPAWDVPMSIARREFLPQLRRDPTYLTREHIMIVGAPAGDPSGEKIPWAKISAREFNFHLRQSPGAGNALGRVKFEMPNKFGVYLHDTPSTGAFARSDRDLSHGCLRVERILALASVALDGDSTVALNTLNQIIAAGKTERRPLASALPVYVLYWTAFVDDAGVLEFRRDLYGRDARLLAALKREPTSVSIAQLGTCPITG